MKTRYDKKRRSFPGTEMEKLLPIEVIGREIRKSRLASRLSQRELAQRAGTTQTTIALVENGQTNPSLGLLDKIAEALNKELAIGLRRKLF